MTLFQLSFTKAVLIIVSFKSLAASQCENPKEPSIPSLDLRGSLLTSKTELVNTYGGSAVRPE